ncbi:hypothetical protein ACFQU7_11975 [Pseudoroseomonas wenyumeiae]
MLEVLREARPVQRRLTLPEGLTAKQIIALIDAAPGLTGNTPRWTRGRCCPRPIPTSMATPVPHWCAAPPPP